MFYCSGCLGIMVVMDVGGLWVFGRYRYLDATCGVGVWLLPAFGCYACYGYHTCRVC